MNPEYKTRWLAALRDGARTQGKTYLKQKLEDGSYAYCCLGVAAEIFSKELLIQRSELHGTILFDGLAGFPAIRLRGAMGISSRTCMTLAEMNDKHGKSFEEIADWIDANE